MTTYRHSFHGKTVLITGASMGLGEMFARELAALGANLVLVARSGDKMRCIANDLVAHYETRVTIIEEDLAKAQASAKVLQAVHREGLQIDLLINNAGFGAHGPFDALELSAQREAIDLNVGTLVELTHRFLPELEQRRGGIIQIASTAAFQPVGYMAVYAATKAFVLSFSEALWAEYRSRNVHVMAHCPGATDTHFFARAGEGAAFGKKAKPQLVVRRALRAYVARRPVYVDGFANRMLTWVIPWFTRAFVAKFGAWLMVPRDRKKPS